MPRVKIKQLDDRVATAGMHMGGPIERRKLHPGEVVEIPEGNLLDALWQTGKLEMTLDPANRPLEFENAREAQLTSPTFKSRGPDEDRQIAEAHAAVAARLAETTSDVPDETGSPADGSQPDASDDPVPAEKSTASNRRAQRRAALQGAERGKEAAA